MGAGIVEGLESVVVRCRSNFRIGEFEDRELEAFWRLACCVSCPDVKER